uniref:RING-type domain-containing protein n=1 Tax=Acrobeloides nanus TaxID=290746 RepID=A0A914EH56_9BILA
MSAIGECSVCSEPLEVQLATLPCGHIFHYECVEKWINMSKNCPKCRKSYNSEELIKLFTELVVENNCDTGHEFRDLFRNLNKIALSNKKLMQLHQDDYNSIETYKKKWQDACFEKEKAELRAVQAEIDLQELRKQHNEMKSLHETYIRNLEDQLEEIKAQLRKTYELATIIKKPASLMLNQPESSNSLGLEKAESSKSTKTPVHTVEPTQLKTTHFGDNTIYMETNTATILIKPNKNNIQKISNVVKNKIEICINCEVELVKMIQPNIVDQKGIDIEHYITAAELKENEILALTHHGLNYHIIRNHSKSILDDYANFELLGYL